MAANQDYEVIIIGGSYAGLSAAMALGRSLRKVLILDVGQRCNRQTPNAHNFLTQDGIEPGIIAEQARVEVLRYNTVKLLSDVAISGKKTETGFEVNTGLGETYFAKKLILAAGIKDLMPAIKGFAECWGISVVHCPYCHGYEISEQKTGILTNGPHAMHLVGLVNNLSSDITVLTRGKADFQPAEITKLNQHHIRINQKELLEIVHQQGQMEKVIFEDGSEEEFSALYAAVPFEQNSNLAQLLGCEFTEAGHIKVDHFQASTVPGIYACGDAAAMMRSIASAVYTGNLAGAMLNKDLVDQVF